ncbi:bifunctional proline dehydrogenase/L-glutamate gamma-semialdehyde dehydrogenase [Brevibacterium sp. HMSC07C04]|uniref:proline dehydrogenase family protein n=1 Tax=Brevibacterium sp. HMSC07C04 TaxID=1581130 RepID=UPI0008A55859|nr:bifunctional proline dehydrogenase/L-glutamate gamma-semialdehyde dehydrogenase [Brevibacterium sp. HMSC07C04]OFS25000.1 aldehyde dehydrogenase [Brevibacterium sp. HMSC07C04]
MSQTQPADFVTDAELSAVSTDAINTVRTWLRRAREKDEASSTSGTGAIAKARPSGSAESSANPQANGAANKATRQADKGARLLAAVLKDPNGLPFTQGFVDRVIRTEDPRAAAKALTEIAELTPKSLPLAERMQIKAGAAMAEKLPHVVIPIAKARLRQMVGHMVIDARPEPFGKAVKAMHEAGHRLNINLLGEAVLGEQEADRHLQDTRRLLARDDVDYVSIKVSSVASQISMWDYPGTVDYVVNRLRPLYEDAVELEAAGRGPKFINLDMEEYQDLHLTIDVFERLLSEPAFKQLEAGIVLQAYLPDALEATQRIAEFGAQRVADGGAGIKVRLVKGANLSMERVHAETAEWPLTVNPSKQATDANYKRVLHWLLTPENMKGLRLGAAGHNLFDIAFAHHLSKRRGVEDRVEFEMLHGMAEEQSEQVAADVGDILLYVPAVAPEQFDVAISYLVRRLEENAANENFMSGIFDLTDGGPIFQRERSRFLASMSDLETVLAREGDTPPGPNRTQNRLHEAPLTSQPGTSGESAGTGEGEGNAADGIDVAAEGASGEAPSESTAATSTATDAANRDPKEPTVLPMRGFANEPNTDPALPANQEWSRQVIAAAERIDISPRTADDFDVDATVQTAKQAAADWAKLGSRGRLPYFQRAAELFAQRRGEFLAVAAAEAGKTLAQSDPELSEAIDFIRYYADQALEIEEIEARDGVQFTPDQVTVITPPWNFPVAIPTGSTVAALAAGSAVIHKPSGMTPACSRMIVETLWQAGIPRNVLQLVPPIESDTGKALISHPDVDRIILTGASDTAALFRSFRPSLAINAETSGKNAMIITPSADRDLAVADLVNSAFGHAGQKCSAASLGILVGSMYDSQRFLRQLVDATESLIVDSPLNLASTVGPLTGAPSNKLQRGLTRLEVGEEWLIKPKLLAAAPGIPTGDISPGESQVGAGGTSSDSDRRTPGMPGPLWRPGIRTGVQPGSFFHMTECFGPVLGLMHARNLDEAIRLQNAVDYGLTAGIHSLDPREVEEWLRRVQAGNLYVNRGITGAIVRRQSFGGWKKSSVGLGSKAGGPNYVHMLGTWADALVSASQADEVEAPKTSTSAGDAGGSVSGTAATRDERDWLERAGRSDDEAIRREFGVARDSDGFASEANIFRYLPTAVTVRVTAEAKPVEITRVAEAAERLGAPLTWSVASDAEGSVRAAAIAAAGAGGSAVGTGGSVVVESASEFGKRLADGSLLVNGAARVRSIGAAEAEVLEAIVDRPEVAVLDEPVTASGRIEGRYYLHEQAISMTLHRFGDPDPGFHRLAQRLGRTA